MLRIIPATDVNGSVVLKLEGQVRGRWVNELRHVVSKILQQPDGRLALDLSEVSFVDADGFELLRELRSRRVGLSNCSLFVTEQLQALEETS